MRSRAKNILSDFHDVLECPQLFQDFNIKPSGLFFAANGSFISSSSTISVSTSSSDSLATLLRLDEKSPNQIPFPTLDAKGNYSANGFICLRFPVRRRRRFPDEKFTTLPPLHSAKKIGTSQICPMTHKLVKNHSFQVANKRKVGGGFIAFKSGHEQFWKSPLGI